VVAASTQTEFDANRPIDLGSKEFAHNKYEWYRWMLEDSPACMGKISVMKINLVSRYEDCRMVLTDERFVRGRALALGKKGASQFPIPMPKAVKPLAMSMIQEDDPEHRRKRNLVNRAFTPRAVAALEDRVEEVSHELLDSLEVQGSFDLLEHYARPVPTRVIAEMVGVSSEDAEAFHKSMSVLSKGMTGYSLVKTLLWDIRGASKFVRGLIARKREQPADDILTRLIEADEEGDRLSEDELLGMVFLLIIAGFETTLHSISNGLRVLLEHPEQLERLRAEPELWNSAVEEIIRHRGPVHGTKMQYATEDVTLHGHTIKKGTPTMPMLGAANHDPREFEKPDEFDIARSPNRHLGFGIGNHFCLGKQLAVMETRIALKNLFDRYPDVRIAVDARELKVAAMAGWHRHVSMPVTLR
jgi:cytochrome P450